MQKKEMHKNKTDVLCIITITLGLPLYGREPFCNTRMRRFIPLGTGCGWSNRPGAVAGRSCYVQSVQYVLIECCAPIIIIIIINRICCFFAQGFIRLVVFLRIVNLPRGFSACVYFRKIGFSACIYYQQQVFPHQEILQ